MGRYDLLICDIDGCLAPETSEPMNIEKLSLIADHNRRAIARQDRLIITLCSGRPIPFVETLCRVLQNTTVPCVAENGVWLYDPSNNGYAMDDSIGPDEVKIVHAAEQRMMELYHEHGVRIQPGKSASLSLYHPDPNYLESIAPAVEKEFHSQGWPLRVSLTLFYINCDFSQISKATGIRRLLSQTGIDPHRTAGIGDTSSDLGIAEVVETFGCPSNAIESVKAAADFISEHEQIDGVLDFIQYLESN